MPPEASASPGALTGLRVLDLTGRMGGYGGLLLANLGAEVILIEPPGGDPLRSEGPFKNEEPHRERSISFAAYHSNKRGIVLDLDNDDDQSTLRELARAADVLLEDKPAGYLDGRGLGYSALQSINPGMVMTSITGFGQTGPYRDFKAPNIVAFAMGGLMNLCGHPGRAPLMGPCDVAYHLGSVHAAFGTLVALFNRRASGRGEHIDVSLQDVLAADPFLRVMTRYSVTGEIPQRTGHSQSTTVAETYQCRDGYARVFVNQADHWKRFIERNTKSRKIGFPCARLSTVWSKHVRSITKSKNSLTNSSRCAWPPRRLIRRALSSSTNRRNIETTSPRSDTPNWAVMVFPATLINSPRLPGVSNAARRCSGNTRGRSVRILPTPPHG
ncbi:MAG: hypothetical protein E6J73_06700 [Deltaproteobacteria bacterium]|nr:MAG: hypothetical protein E6J73_06700 [Deltaproteobacteria bacterium]